MTEAEDTTGAPVRTAPGGWRRMVTAFAVGAAAGAVLALVLPRDDAPRRW